MTQGKCHKCQKWIALEGVKDVEAKVDITSFAVTETFIHFPFTFRFGQVKEIFWFVHTRFIEGDYKSSLSLQQVETCGALPPRFSNCGWKNGVYWRWRIQSGNTAEGKLGLDQFRLCCTVNRNLFPSLPDCHLQTLLWRLITVLHHSWTLLEPFCCYYL